MAQPLRLFVGFPIGNADAAALAAQLVGAPWRGATGIRWVPRADWHVTLHFLGATPAERVPELMTMLDAVTPEPGPVQPVAATVTGIGPFPRRRPVAIAGHLAPGSELSAWASAIGRACQAAGLSADRRPFRAHVTLGRLRGETQDSWQDVEVALLLDRVVLFRSETLPEGARYSPVHVRRLGPAP